MSELIKKAYFKNAAGIIQTAKLYTTLTETQGQGVSIIVDDIQAYMKYAEATDTSATAVRIKLSDGSIKAVLSQAQIPYGSITYTTNGTFTPPAGVTKVRVSMTGGGGGGGGYYYGNTGIGGNGGNTSFGTYMTAIGGTGGGASDNGIGGGRDINGGIPTFLWNISGQPGQLNGGPGQGGLGYGGGGGGLYRRTTNGPNGGNGGSQGGSGTYSGNCTGGGSGAWMIGKVIELNSDGTIPIIIGTGGMWWNNTVRSGQGAQGIAFVEWGGDIE